MKALSVRQPWAYEIMTGEKRIEYRTWKTDYRGPLLICSSQKPDPDYFKLNKATREKALLGCAVCIVDLILCRGQKGDYEWILRNPRAIEPFPVKGKLNLFNVDYEPE